MHSSYKSGVPILSPCLKLYEDIVLYSYSLGTSPSLPLYDSVAPHHLNLRNEGSVTASAYATPSAASMALPPSSIILLPTLVAIALLEATPYFFWLPDCLWFAILFSTCLYPLSFQS